MKEFLKPISLTDEAWCYVDDKGIEFITGTVVIRKLSWCRLDRLRKQAETARAEGKYKT